MVDDESPTPTSATLSEIIRTGLADDITSGRLPMGAEIDEQAIADRFGASRTPVRDALRALAAAGLVSMAPRRAARVVALTLDRLGEMFEVMAELEALCARLAAHRMTPVERLTVLTRHRQSLDAVNAGDVNLYDVQNREFHAALYRGTHNAFLAEHAAALRIRLAPYRRAQFRSGQRLRQSHDEHDAIIAQLLRGDGEEAGRLMRAHILTASVILAEYLTAPPSQPESG